MATHIAMLQTGDDAGWAAFISLCGNTATGIGKTQEAAAADLRMFVALVRQDHIRHGETVPAAYDEPLEITFGEFDDKGELIVRLP